MTDRCSGAASRVKSGVPGEAQVGTSTISAAISAFAPYLMPIAILIEGFSIEMQSMCAGDPPAMPSFDALDMSVVIGGVVNPHFAETSRKVGDLLYNWFWPLYCECVDGTPPLQVQPPLPPQGANYGSSVGIRPCSMGGWAGNAPLGNADPPPSNTGIDVGYRILPTDGTTRTFTVANSTYVAYRKLTGVTDAKWTRKSVVPQGTQTSVGPNIAIKQWTDANVLAKTTLLNQNWDTPTQSGTFTIGSSATWLTAYAGAEPIFGAFDNITDPLVTVNLEWYCGQAPGTQSDCCPPDPSIALTLNNLVSIVTDIQNRLGQGESGYVDGYRHSNVRGTGSVILQGDALAVRVETHPPFPPVIILPGTPSYYYDMGFVTPYILQSPLRSTRVTFTNQTVQLPRHTDQLGYTLLNGITVDLVELIAAPAEPSSL